MRVLQAVVQVREGVVEGGDVVEDFEHFMKEKGGVGGVTLHLCGLVPAWLGAPAGLLQLACEVWVLSAGEDFWPR